MVLDENKDLNFNDSQDDTSMSNLLREFKKFEGKELDFDDFKSKIKNPTKPKRMSKQEKKSKNKMTKISRRKNRH